MAPTHQNGSALHLVRVRVESIGQFTAQVVGLPDVRVTAATRDDALAGVERLMRNLIASGELVLIDVETSKTATVRKDPSDPNEQAYLKALARDREEDLAQTLRELDQECPNSSSTPTT